MTTSHLEINLSSASAPCQTKGQGERGESVNSLPASAGFSSGVRFWGFFPPKQTTHKCQLADVADPSAPAALFSHADPGIITAAGPSHGGMLATEKGGGGGVKGCRTKGSAGASARRLCNDAARCYCMR